MYLKQGPWVGGPKILRSALCPWVYTDPGAGGLATDEGPWVLAAGSKSTGIGVGYTKMVKGPQGMWVDAHLCVLS